MSVTQESLIGWKSLARDAMLVEYWGSNFAVVDGEFASEGPAILAARCNWANGSCGLPNCFPPHIKICLQYGIRHIHLKTAGNVKPQDLALIINPVVAQSMAVSEEVLDYINQSPYALAQIQNLDLESRNRVWGISDTIYTIRVFVEDEVSDRSSYKMSDSVAYLINLPDSDVPPFDVNASFKFDHVLGF